MFVLDTYTYTSGFPKSEIYGLTSQFRRASVSIAANIAEGFRRTTVKEKVRYLTISRGSLEECRYYLILTSDLGFGQNKELQNVLEEVGKMLHSYSNAIRNFDKRK